MKFILKWKEQTVITALLLFRVFGLLWQTLITKYLQKEMNPFHPVYFLWSGCRK